MRTQSIAPKRLLQDSFALVKPIYGSLVLILIPNSLFDLLGIVIPQTIYASVVFIYNSSINLIVSGAAIFYAYNRLNHRETTVSDSLHKAINKFPQIILSQFLVIILVSPLFLLLVIPGLYFSVRLAFILFAIMIEDHSAIDAIKRSWQLVKGRWWSVFFALSVMIIALYVPFVLISMIVASVFQVSFIELFFGIGSGLASVIDKLVSSILSFLINPMIIMYSTLMFMSVLVLERQGKDTV